jgi:hypothetical protein
LIQFLVDHGHAWKDVQGYTLSQVGIFLKEAAKLDETNHKHDILAVWLGFNSDQKGLKKILDEKVVHRKPEDKQQEYAQNWNKLSAMVRQMR